MEEDEEERLRKKREKKERKRSRAYLDENGQPLPAEEIEKIRQDRRESRRLSTLGSDGLPLTEEERKRRKRERKESRRQSKLLKQQTPAPILAQKLSNIAEAPDPNNVVPVQEKATTEKEEQKPEEGATGETTEAKTVEQPKSAGKGSALEKIEYAALAILVLDVVLLIAGIALFAMSSPCETDDVPDLDDFEGGEADAAVQAIDASGVILPLETVDDLRATFDCGKPKVDPDTAADGEAVSHSWPWAVMVTVAGDSGDDTHLCSGALLTSRHVLTAASCFTADKEFERKYKALVGLDNKGTEKDGKTVEVAEIRLHPMDILRDGEPEYDFALLSLREEIALNDNILPACLPQPDKLPPEEAECWSQEWSVSESEKSLKQSKVGFMSESVCMEKYKPENNKERVTCGNKTSDVCVSDRGGPVVCEEDGKWTMYGVTSYGPEDCEGDLPFVYASVPFHVSWLCCFMENVEACAMVHCKPSGDPDEEAPFVAKLYPEDEFQNKDHKRGEPTIKQDLGRSGKYGRSSVAVAHSWPWVVDLTEFTSKGLEHFCIGALISPRHVLSAATCFKTDRGFDDERLYAIVRVHQRQSGTVHRVSVMREHPKSKGNDGLTYDLVLLTVEPEVDIDDNAMPAALPGLNVELEEGTKCWTQGWGEVTEEEFELSQTEITVSSMNESEICEEMSGYFEMGDAICASTSKQLCEADSGGPVACEEDGIWVLYGVVNMRAHCVTDEVEIFASISAAMGWICCFMQDLPECAEQGCEPDLPAATPKTDNTSRIFTAPVPTEDFPQGSTKMYPEDTFFPHSVCGQTDKTPDLAKGRIVGGAEAVAHSWPWVVAITEGSSDVSNHSCAASIISPRHLVSSANCFVEDKAFEDGKLYAWLGYHGPGSGKQYKVVRLRLHPKFKKEAPYAYDVAMLTIDPEMSLNDPNFGPACLPEQYFDVEKGTECWTQGWGTTNPDRETSSETLQQAMMNIVYLPQCSRKLDLPLEREYSICAGEVLNQGSCLHDSGAPLVCQEGTETGKEWVLYGSTGMGRALSCGDGNMSAYASVSFTLDWICCFLSNMTECHNAECIYDGNGKMIKTPVYPDAPAPDPMELQPEDAFEYVERCGIPRIKPRVKGARITGGYVAVPHSWPWAVSLQEADKHFCNGVIITQRHVLTAAYCVAGILDSVQAGRVVALVGHHSSKDVGKAIQIINARVHPRFKAENIRRYNVALLTLDKALVYSDTVDAACLPGIDVTLQLEQRGCYVQGWGATDINLSSPSDELKHLLAQNNLNPSMCMNLPGPEYDESETFCAETSREGGTCALDEGAPYVCNVSAVYILHGIANDPGCREQFSFYLSVQFIMNWLCCFLPSMTPCDDRCTYA